MFFEMKAFLVVFVLGISLKVAQSEIDVDLNMNPFFAESADAVRSGYKPCCHPATLEGSAVVLVHQIKPNGSAKFHIDGINRKFAAQNVITGVKIIIRCDLHSTCFYYNIEENQKYCSKRKLTNASIDDFWLR